MHFPFFLALDPCVSRDTCTLTIYLLIQSRSYFFFSVSSKSAFMQLQILIHKLYCKSHAKPLEKYQNWLKYVNFHCFEGKRRTPISSTVQLYTSDVRQHLRKQQQVKKKETKNKIKSPRRKKWDERLDDVFGGFCMNRCFYRQKIQTFIGKYMWRPSRDVLLHHLKMQFF